MTFSVEAEDGDAIDNATEQDSELEARLVAWFRDNGSTLIGFSGGVDSAYLACVALDALSPSGVLAVIGRSASYPAEQWERARAVAQRFGVPVLEVATDELNDQRYSSNPTNRCYFCKTELWNVLLPIAADRGFDVVVDGTNADDLTDHRPGGRAASEHGVRSPLAELGFSKAAIRRLSRSRGIPTWSQPSSPCLSSRIPYGTAVTIERLRQVERAEAALRATGVTGDMRVRYHGDLARVELGPDVVGSWLEPGMRSRVYHLVRSAGFDRVAVDARGFRSGSLNVLGGVVAEPLIRARSIASGDGAGLANALHQGGISCDVEARERLALLRCAAASDIDALCADSVRAAVADTARGHGFTHVAIEVGTAVSDAAVHRG
jgi:uncharacterized protein